MVEAAKSVRVVSAKETDAPTVREIRPKLALVK